VRLRYGNKPTGRENEMIDWVGRWAYHNSGHEGEGEGKEDGMGGLGGLVHEVTREK